MLRLERGPSGSTWFWAPMPKMAHPTQYLSTCLLASHVAFLKSVIEPPTTIGCRMEVPRLHTAV